MFIGHYAVSIAASSPCRQRGALTYISLSSILPDLFMLSTGSMNSSFNYHADWGFVLCVLVAILFGIIFKFYYIVRFLAIASLILHLPLDYPYSSQDNTNWYAYPLQDFLLEVTFLLIASAVYILKQKLHGKRLAYFLLTTTSLIVVQGIWNFSFSYK